MFKKCVFRKLAGLAVSPASSVDSIVEVVDANIAPCGACASKSANPSPFASRESGTLSKMMSKDANAAAASPNGKTVTRAMIVGINFASKAPSPASIDSLPSISLSASARKVAKDAGSRGLASSK